MGTAILHMSPRTFWRTTPKMFFALLQTHVEVNGGKKREKSRGVSKQPTAYVDQLSFM